MKWVRVRGVVMVGSGADEGVGGLRRLCSWVGLQSKASKRGFKAKAELSPACGRPSLKPGFHRPAAGPASSQAFTGLRPAQPHARLSPACGRPTSRPGFPRPAELGRAAGRGDEFHVVEITVGARSY